MRSDIFKNQAMMMKLKKTDIMMRSGISGVNFENTVIISVIGASLSCIILSLIVSFFLQVLFTVREALFFNLFYLQADLCNLESISFKQQST